MFVIELKDNVFSDDLEENVFKCVIVQVKVETCLIMLCNLLCHFHIKIEWIITTLILGLIPNALDNDSNVDL